VLAKLTLQQEKNDNMDRHMAKNITL